MKARPYTNWTFPIFVLKVASAFGIWAFVALDALHRYPGNEFVWLASIIMFSLIFIGCLDFLDRRKERLVGKGIPMKARPNIREIILVVVAGILTGLGIVAILIGGILFLGLVAWALQGFPELDLRGIAFENPIFMSIGVVGLGLVAWILVYAYRADKSSIATPKKT